MKKLFIYLFLILSVTIISCTKTEDSNSSSSNVSSPFTVKYEVISTSNAYASWGMPMVTYVNSTGQKETESVSSLSTARAWSKTVNVTTPTRPLNLNLLLSTSPPDVYRLWLKSAGEITQNLYVNGTLVASSSNKSSTISSDSQYDIKIIALDYTVK